MPRLILFGLLLPCTQYASMAGMQPRPVRTRNQRHIASMHSMLSIPRQQRLASGFAEGVIAIIISSSMAQHP